MNSGSDGTRNVDRQIDIDLAALRESTRRDLPGIERTARLCGERLSREGFLMRSINWLRLRPVLATGFAIACIVFVLLAVPITYTHVTGFEVRLAVTTADLNPDVLMKLGGELQKALHSDQVSVGVTGDGANLTARVPASFGRRGVEAAARAFAESLEPHGIDAGASVTPITEKVSTNLVAYASGRLVEIRIEREGKTTAQIEEEIRSQLAAAGFGDADVQVTEDGERMQIHITKQSDGQGDAVEDIEARVTVDGVEPQNQVRVGITKDSDHPMTDDELRDEVLRQLREQGVEADVVVRDGKIESITPHN